MNQKIAPLLMSSLATIALLTSTRALAKNRHPAAVPSPAPALKEGTTAPLDELEQALVMFKSKPAAMLKKAYDFLQAKKYSTAKKIVNPLVDDPKFGDYARWISAQSNERLAEKAMEQKRYPDAHAVAQTAVRTLGPIEELFPYSPFVKTLPRDLAQAELTSGEAQCKQKSWNSCKSEIENALARVFGTPEMAYVTPDGIDSYAGACKKSPTQICLSWVQRLAQYYPKSTEEFKALTDAFPQYADEVPKPEPVARSSQNYKAPDPDQDAIDQAIALYLDGKTKEAIDAFRKFTDTFPRSSARFRALYWLAQALKKNGKAEEAKSLLTELHRVSPLSYYGLLAAIDTGGEIDSGIDVAVPNGADSDIFLSPMEVYKLARSRAFLAQKAEDLAAIELKDFHSREGLTSGFLAYLAMLQAKAGNYSVAFPVVNELINRNYPGMFSPYFAKMIFPIDELPLIQKIADDLKVDPLLALSLTKQESAFNSTATSVSGALGLMQLMPVTAVETMPGQTRRGLLTGETNVKVGTTYLGHLLEKFQGNIVYSVASYNAGPGAVNRWIHAAPPGRGMLEFVESIPYRETREYVAAIIRNYYWYAKLSDPELSKSLTLDFFWHNYGPPLSVNVSPSPEPNPTKP